MKLIITKSYFYIISYSYLNLTKIIWIVQLQFQFRNLIVYNFDCICFYPHTHIIKISFINLSRKFAKEKISTVFDSFLFSIRYLYGCIEKKKKKKNEKGKKWKDRANDSNTRCPFLWHFCGNFGILVTPENELYHVIMVC